MTDSEPAELFGFLVRLAAGCDEALALMDKVLGISGPRPRLSTRELASARSEAASCRAQLTAVRLRVATVLEGGALERETAEVSPTRDDVTVSTATS